MKILHLVDERWDSGLTAYALQVAQLLHRAGEQVTVGVLAGKKPEALAIEKGLVTAPYQGAFALRRLLKRPWDIINVHTGRTHSWATLTRALGGRSSVPIIRTRGDARPVGSHPLLRFVYARTAGFIAASAHIAKQFADLGLGEDRCEVIYPGIDADASIAPLPADRVGILGRLDPVKGHAVFLEAAATILKTRPNVRFVIAGKDAGVSAQLLRNQAEQLGIANAVEFTGFTPDARAFMRTCTVGVVASIGSEEISRACMEWMSVGRPVVATLVGSLPELVEPEETGSLVAPNDGVAMAEAVGRLLSDPAMAEAQGKAGRERILLRFSPEKLKEQTLNFYRRVGKRA